VHPVLCLHGFTGTPFDVGALAVSLEAEGYLVRSPMLPGHGGTVAALGVTGADDWLSGADEALTRLADETGGRVAIVGASMGALLALRLSRRRPDTIAALVLMSAPLRWHPLRRYGVDVLARLAALVGVAASIPKFGGVDAADPQVREAAPSINAFPLAALRELFALSDAAAGDVPSVTAPALVIHGRLDRTVPLDVSEALASTLGSSIVERLWLARSGHLVAVDYDRAAVAIAVNAFLTRHARWATPPHADRVAIEPLG
jgi:carboxylesterase